MAKTKAKRKQAGPNARRSRVAPATRERQRRLGWLAWLGVGVLAAAGAFWVAKEQATGGGEAIEPPAVGLPHTPDYHSLLVDPDDPQRILLGTHVGVYESTDGGRKWRFAGLEGKDAMHFARHEDGTVWAAGHNVLEKSSDGGRTWREVRPDGLPGLDIHGFAVGQDNSLLYAAVAGEGLYVSDDGAETFRPLSKDVGPSVMALAVTKDGQLFAADGDRGVLINSNGDGVEWREALGMETLGLAVNTFDPPGTRLLAGGRSGSVQLFTYRERWKEVLAVEDGAGPVAFAASDPSVAYAVGFDRKLYRSDDGGETWRVVA